MLWLVKSWQTINIVSLLLWPLSLLYCFLITVRRLAYQTGLFKSYSPGLPVIIVGNLTVGGTGKTPLVIWLASWLESRGHRPGIVLRGYGGQSKTWPRQVKTETSADEVGDEAVLLAQHTGCPVVAAPDRVAAARKLVADSDCTIIISDDGLQHYRLRRDYEVSVVDGARRYGNGFCLPAGPLREPATRANKVDLVVTNGANEETDMTMNIQATGIRNLVTNNRVDLNEFDNKSLHAVAGIGNPARFFDTLNELGIQTTGHVFADHHRFSADDLNFSDNREIIMTAKDAVKCKRFAQPNYWVLEVEAKPSKAVVKKLQSWVEEIHVG